MPKPPDLPASSRSSLVFADAARYVRGQRAFCISGSAEEIFLFFPEWQFLPKGPLVLHSPGVHISHYIKVMIQVHRVRLGRAGRHVENQQSARIQQTGQEVELTGKIGQVFQYVEGE